MNAPAPKSDFVRVNGILLHYLDWGGEGPALIFLTGMGSSAYIYNKFAPRFTDWFHVLGLTRRGHGDSDYPETGYDADTLVEDIRGFMDCLGIEKASLAGHSLAGVELTHLAASHPEKVVKLVYLDALDDRRGLLEINERNPLRRLPKKRGRPRLPRTLQAYIANLKKDIPEFAQIWSDLWDEEIAHAVKVDERGVIVDRMPQRIEAEINENLVINYAPPEVAARLPVLSFYALGRHPISGVYTKEQETLFRDFQENTVIPFARSLIAEFQGRFPQAKIVVIPYGHHYCFIAQEELVYEEMRRFLLE